MVEVAADASQRNRVIQYERRRRLRFSKKASGK
jgi:hypothetical protein